MRLALASVALTLLLSETAVYSAVRNVPADYSTIQAAIVAAVNGDTVIVAPGVYTENISFQGKSVRLMSSGGAAVTTLRPAAPSATLIALTSGEPTGTEISGLTLSGGDMKHLIDIGGGARPWIHHSIIRDHVSYESNATEIGSYASTPVIEYCLFSHNRSIGGVGVFSGGGTIANNTFHENSRGFWSQGTGVVARNNIVTNSVQFGVGDDGFAVNNYNCVYNNNPNYDYGAIPGVNDISSWPEYCDTSVDNYGLDAISPCLGSGEAGTDIGAFGIACGFGVGPRVVALTVSGGQSGHVTDPNPVIGWNYFDPAGEPQLESEIEVGSDPDWTAAEMWDPLTFAGGATSQIYGGAELIDGTDYFVRVRVNNGIEWGVWSVRTFHTNTPPPIPTMETPVDSFIVTSGAPTLRVSPNPDGEGDLQTYTFEVYSDEALTVLVTSGSNKPTTWTVSPPLIAENQPHWWRARANDGFEDGPWTASRLFYLDAQNSPPMAGLLIAPIGGVAVPSTAPHFDWEEATDVDPGQIAFVQTLILATDSNFTFSTQMDNIPLSEFTFGGLQVAQRYWWKVRFTDPDGLTADASPARFFIPGPGDMNMNQTLDVVDVVMVVDAMFRGIPGPEAAYLLDVNGDCVPTVTDVVTLIGHVFRNGPLPLTICPTPATALRVPSEFTTISSAVSAATDNDIVLVAPGTYRDNIDFVGKRVHLQSEEGPAVTFIEPEVPTSPIVQFTRGERLGVEMTGFTIRGGTGKHIILITNGSEPWIHDNVIVDHVTYDANATAIGSFDANPVIEYNLFLHTRSLGGVGIFSGGGTINNNTFNDNSRGFWSLGAGVVARNNIVTNSVEFGVGAEGFAVNDYNCVFNNVLEYAYGAVPGPNDINADPLYCNPTSGDFRLGPGSPCLGNGFGGVDRGALGPGCTEPK